MEPIEEILSKTLELRKQLLDYHLQLKDAFLSLVSHELRSPLTSIYQFTTIILDGLAGDVNDEQREYLRICLRNIQELQGMIDELLIATRARSGGVGVVPERLPLSAVIETSLEPLEELAEEKGIDLRWTAPPELPAAYADRALLSQALVHLVHNGIKFTPPGGSVQVRCGAWTKDPGFLLIQVTDTGCGMPKDLADRVFTRLANASDSARDRESGFGLGLFITQDLVSRQGGGIWMESEAGEGSTFSFTVPTFSISRLLLPLMSNSRRRPGTLALLVIDLAAPDGRLLKVEDGQLFRDLLRHRLVPGLETLLPELDGNMDRPRACVVGSTEENSNLSVRDRVQEQLERSVGIHRLGLSWSATAFGLEGEKEAPAQGADESLSRIAKKIETLLDEDALARRQDLPLHSPEPATPADPGRPSFPFLSGES